MYIVKSCCLPLITLFLAFSLIPGYSFSQQSFTHIFSLPGFINPANTGASKYSQRAGIAFLHQSTHLTSQSSSGAFFYDMSVLNSKMRANDCFALGVAAQYDKNIADGLKNTGLSFSMAYKKGLNESGDNYIGIGFKTSFYQKRIEPKKILDERQILNLLQSGITNFDGFGFYLNPFVNIRYFDLSTGINVQTDIGKKNTAHFGITVSHVNKPAQQFSGGYFSLSPAVSFQASNKTLLGYNQSLYLYAYYMTEKTTADELLAGGIYRYPVESSNIASLALLAGASLKHSSMGYTAVLPLMGISYKQYVLRISYGLRLSETPAYYTNGAEISFVFDSNMIK